MKSKGKKSSGVSGCLIIVILVLICAAVGLSMSGNATDMVDQYFSDDASEQISLEIKKKQVEQVDTVSFEGLDEDETKEAFYIVRLNHETDMNLNLVMNVKKASDGVDEALKLKVFDKTNNKILVDDSLRNLDDKVISQLKIGNASKKNDTRYEMTFYFDADVDDRYENTPVEVEFKWYVDDEDQKNLLTAKTGEIIVILYAFIAAIVLLLLFFIFGRKYINPEVFKDVKKEQIEEKE